MNETGHPGGVWSIVSGILLAHRVSSLIFYLLLQISTTPTQTPLPTHCSQQWQPAAERTKVISRLVFCAHQRMQTRSYPHRNFLKELNIKARVCPCDARQHNTHHRNHRIRHPVHKSNPRFSNYYELQGYFRTE